MADPAASIRNPRLEVVMDDGAVLEVQTLNVDFVQWDLSAYKQNWPPTERAPILFLTFLAFHALRREEQIPNMKWERFMERATQVRMVDVDGDEGAPVMGPTLPAPGQG